MRGPRLLRNPRWRGVLLGLGCASAAWLLGQTGAARGLEEWSLDGCFAYRGVRASPAHSRVVLIGLAEASLERLGKPLAYSSPELAEVVLYLKQRGAAAIGLDASLPESMQGWPGLRADHAQGEDVHEVQPGHDQAGEHHAVEQVTPPQQRQDHRNDHHNQRKKEQSPQHAMTVQTAAGFMLCTAS